MKKLMFIVMLTVGVSMSMQSQNLRFWTVGKEQGDKYIVSVYVGNMTTGSETELLKGFNIRYYYESADMEFLKFGLSEKLVSEGFNTFGGQGNNGFRSDDDTRYGKADRFVGEAPFVFSDGAEIASGERVPVGTITFQKNPGVRASDIESYMIGEKIFRAMTYNALPGCTDGCPVIVIAPPASATPVASTIDLEAVKYGPRYSHLTWGVSSPDGIRGYIVERKKGEGEWKVLANLESEGQYVHVYVDENAYDGVSLKESVTYRVKVLTQDGEQVSDLETLDFSSQKMIVEVFPNPASDKVQVTMTATKTEGETYLEMYGTDGRLVYRNALQPGSIKEQIDLASANVDSGSYTVHLVADGEILDVRSLHVMR